MGTAFPLRGLREPVDGQPGGGWHARPCQPHRGPFLWGITGQSGAQLQSQPDLTLSSLGSDSFGGEQDPLPRVLGIMPGYAPAVPRPCPGCALGKRQPSGLGVLLLATTYLED